jgi:hypothetical protein
MNAAHYADRVIDAIGPARTIREASARIDGVALALAKIAAHEFDLEPEDVEALAERIEERVDDFCLSRQRSRKPRRLCWDMFLDRVEGWLGIAFRGGVDDELA